MISNFQPATGYTQQVFNPYSLKDYDAVLECTMGCDGEPLYDLTILERAPSACRPCFLAAHGTIVEPFDFKTANDAAAWLLNWYELNKRPAA